MQYVVTLSDMILTICCRLRCSITDKKMVNLISGHIMKTVTNDIKVIWETFALKLAPLVDDSDSSIGYTNGAGAASADDIKQLLKFYEDKSKEVLYDCA